MGEIVVFPEQFSFDVRQARSNPKRRLTIKNLGINACKVTITMPESDSFTITDAKGKAINSKFTMNMAAESSYIMFVQKKANVGIVPEDKFMVTGGKKPYTISLKPAVSMVSMEELENAAGNPDMSDFPLQADDDNMPSQDEREPKKRVSKLKPPTKRQPAKQTAGNENNANKNKKEPENNPLSNLEFSVSDFMPAKEEPTDRNNQLQPKGKGTKLQKESGASSQASSMASQTSAASIKSTPSKNSVQDVPMPKKLDQSPTKIQSKIPVPRTHKEISPDEDVLENSLHVKFSVKDDAYSKPANKSSILKWYDDDAFDQVEEPYFTFELMMTGEGEDPVFCVDGEYYDSSGRHLSVQQGKGKIIFVTEDGFEPTDE